MGRSKSCGLSITTSSRGRDQDFEILARSRSTRSLLIAGLVKKLTLWLPGDVRHFLLLTKTCGFFLNYQNIWLFQDLRYSNITPIMSLLAYVRLIQLLRSPSRSSWLWRRRLFAATRNGVLLCKKNLPADFRLWLHYCTPYCEIWWSYRAWFFPDCLRVFFWWFFGHVVSWTKWRNPLGTGKWWRTVASVVLDN